MTYRTWIKHVRDQLDSMHMATNEWQAFSAYNFRRSYESGTMPDEAAGRAFRFWWRQQHKVLHDDCHKAVNCWLKSGHEGECQPIVSFNGSTSNPEATTLRCDIQQPTREI